MADNNRIGVSLEFSANTKEARKNILELQQNLQQLSKALPSDLGLELNEEFNKAKISVTELGEMVDHAFNKTTGKLDLREFNKSIQASGKTVQELASELTALGPKGKQAFEQMTNAILEAEMPIKSTNKLLNGLWENLKRTAGWQISSSVIHGLMSGVSQAFSYAQKLNESLNNIRIVTGKSVDEMARFAQAANGAARELSATTTEYTNAALIFYQQGLSAKEVEERTAITLKMANVTGESASAVSDYMTAIWNNFYDGSESLESFADKMTALGAATASSTDEIAAGLEKFASIADTVGLSFDYAAAALATVTATTRQSADTVGTAFRTLFARLEGLSLGETLDDGTDLNKYSAALAKVGINIKDTSGSLKDMDQILDELGARWQSLAKDEQVALAQTVGGTRQYAQLIALMDSWDFFKENLATEQDSSGTLQSQADIFAESWEAAQKRVTAAWQEIYDKLINSEDFIKLLNFVEKFINHIGTLIDMAGGLPGILGVISHLMTSIFSTQITESIRNFGERIRDTFGMTKRDLQDLRLEFSQTFLQNLDADHDITGAANQVLKDRIAFEEQMIRQADQLTERDQARIKAQINLTHVVEEHLLKMAEEAEKLEAQTDELKKQLELKIQLRNADTQQAQLTTTSLFGQDFTGQNGAEAMRGTWFSKTGDAMTDAEQYRDFLELAVDANNGFIASTDTQIMEFFDKWITALNGAMNQSKEQAEAAVSQLELELDELGATLYQESSQPIIDPTTVKTTQKQVELIRTVLVRLKTQKDALTNDKKSLISKKSVDEAKKRIETVIDSYEDLDKETRTNALELIKKTDIKTAQDYIKLIDQLIEKFQVILDQNSTDLFNMVGNSEEVAEDINKINDQVEQYGEATEKAQLNANKMRDSHEHLGKSVGQTKVGFADAVTSFSQIGTAVMMLNGQINGMVSALTDGELTLENFTTVLTSVGSAFRTYQTIIDTIIIAQKIINGLQGEEHKGLIKILASKRAEKASRLANAGGIGVETVAQEDNNEALRKNKTLWETHPILGIIAVALTVILSVISTVTNAIKKNNEAIAENAQKTREQAQASREELKQINAQKKAYDEAREKFEKFGEGKEEYLNTAKQLAQSLSIENAEVLLQQGRYAELNRLIEQQLSLKKQQAAIDARNALNSRGDNRKAAEKALTSGSGFNLSGEHVYKVNATRGDYSMNVHGEAAQAVDRAARNFKILDSLNGDIRIAGNGLDYTNRNDLELALSEINTVLDVLGNYNTADAKQAVESWQEQRAKIQAMLDARNEDVLNGITLLTNNFDFSEENVTLDNYTSKFAELTRYLERAGLYTEDAKKAAHDYLESISGAEVALLDKMKEQMPDTTEEDLREWIQGLSEDELQFVLGLDDSKFQKSWNEFKTNFNKDWEDNQEDLAEAQLMAFASSASSKNLSSALNKLGKLKDGSTIDEKTYNELIESLSGLDETFFKSMFADIGNGQYRLLKSSQDMQKTIKLMYRMRGLEVFLNAQKKMADAFSAIKVAQDAETTKSSQFTDRLNQVSLSEEQFSAISGVNSSSSLLLGSVLTLMAAGKTSTGARRTAGKAGSAGEITTHTDDLKNIAASVAENALDNQGIEVRYNRTAQSYQVYENGTKIRSGWGQSAPAALNSAGYSDLATLYAFSTGVDLQGNRVSLGAGDRQFELLSALANTLGRSDLLKGITADSFIQDDLIDNLLTMLGINASEMSEDIANSLLTGYQTSGKEYLQSINDILSDWQKALDLTAEAGQKAEEAKSALEGVFAATRGVATNLAELGEYYNIASSALKAYNKLTDESNDTNLLYSLMLLDLASNFSNTADEAEQYYAIVQKLGDENLPNIERTSLENLKSAAEDQLKLSIQAGDLASAYDLDVDALEYQARFIQETNKELKLSGEQAAIIAAQNERLNRGMTSLTKNSSAWLKNLRTLDKDSLDYASTLKDVNECLADLTGAISASKVPLNFFDRNTETGTRHLKELEQAATGNLTAIRKLSIDLGKAGIEALNFADVIDVVTNKLDENGNAITQSISETKFNTLKEVVLSGIDDILAAADSLQEGMLLEDVLGENTENWIDSLNQMAKATEMSVAEMQALLKQLQIDAEVKTDIIDTTTNVPVYETIEEDVSSDDGKRRTRTSSHIVDYQPMSSKIEVAQINYGKDIGKMPKISRAGGAGGISPSSMSSGSSGGGSSQKSKKTTDEQDRYHEIDKTLESITKRMDRLNAAKDRAFGAKHLQAIKQEQEELDNYLDALSQKIQENQEYLKEDASKVLGLGAVLDENGNISNYNEIIADLVNQYNAGTIDDDTYSEWKGYLDQYEETLKEGNDLADEYRDKQWEKIDKEVEAADYTVEIKIKITDWKNKILDFALGNLEDLDFQGAERLSLYTQQLANAQDNQKTYQQGIVDLLKAAKASDEQIAAYLAGDASAIADLPDLTTEMIESLGNNTEGYLEAITTQIALLKTMHEELNSTWEEYNTKIDDTISQYEHLQAEADHYLNLVDIMGKKMSGVSNKVLQDLRRKQMKVTASNIEAVRRQMAMNQKNLEDAEAGLANAREIGDEMLIQQWQNTVDNIKNKNIELQEQLWSLQEEYVQKAKDNWSKAVDEMIEKFEAQFSGVYGSFDELAEAFDRRKTIAEQFLPEYQKLYELNKLNRDINKSINETDNVRAKQKLRDIQKEINDLQASGKEMSQYDLDYLQKRYDLKQAEIALEDAQNAKNQVRLTRDSAGNYSYVYTADQSKIDDSIQNYEDKLYALEEISENYITEMSEQYIATLQEMSQALRDAANADYATEEEKNQKLAELQEYYIARLQYFSGEIDKAVNNNMTLYNNEAETYKQLTGNNIDQMRTLETSYQQIILSDLIGKDYKSVTEHFQDVKDAVGTVGKADSLVGKVCSGITDMKNDILKTVGDLTEQITAKNGPLNTLSQKAKDLEGDVGTMAEKGIKAFGDLKDKIVETEKEVGPKLSALKQSAEDVGNAYVQLMEKLMTPIDVPTITVKVDFSSAYAEIAKLKAALASVGSGGLGGTVPKPTEPVTDTFSSRCDYLNEKQHVFKKFKNGMLQSQVTENHVIGWSGKEGENAQYYCTGCGHVFGRKKPEGFRSGGYIGSWSGHDSNPIVSAATGMYTGDFGNEGRLAVLHEKELVLNKNDTTNMLSTVKIVRELANAIDLQAQSSQIAMSSIAPTLSNLRPVTEQTVEQDITINAEFPGVSVSGEIEQAFDNLFLQASQYANRTR